MSTTKLTYLREQIDTLDEQLIKLLAKRIEVVKQVGEYKSEKGISIVAIDREAKMLEKRAKQAAQLNISPQLIETLLRRIMRESYEKESKIQFHQVNKAIKKIVILGGCGKMGSLFKKYFTQSGYCVESLDKHNLNETANLLKNADLVIICVPIATTCDVIANLPMLKKSCILADITSTKVKPLSAMLENHLGPVVGLHPMFGPDIKSFAKQVIVACDGRQQKKYQWLLEQFELWGAQIKHVPPHPHDDAMMIIQALRHFTTFIYGIALSESNPDLSHILNLSSPIYRIELTMVARLFAQSPNLYADIILSNTGNLIMIKHYADCLNKGIKLLEDNDKDKFIELFNKTRDWFGDYAQKLLEESQELIAQVSTK
jgi:chorismate mutase / prephenate dehydrogenase